MIVIIRIMFWIFTQLNAKRTQRKATGVCATKRQMLIIMYLGPIHALSRKSDFEKMNTGVLFPH